MLLSTLLQTVEPLTVSGTTTLEIKGLCYDSRQVQPGDLFFALKGTAIDGHRFIPRAIASGAAAVVAEEADSIPEGVTGIIVADSRLAMSFMAATFFGNPTGTLPLVGITGTNGKTTTSYLVEAILEAAGLPAGVIGTVNYRFHDKIIPAPNTTPESVDLQRVLRSMVDDGARAIVMEVSSHALEQRRVDGCRFQVGIFTNLTRDHLDYHGTMDDYRTSKLRLFTDLLRSSGLLTPRRAVVNLDDPSGREFAGAAACPVITYGFAGPADVTARDVTFAVDGITGVLVTPVGSEPFRSPLLGRFNLSNILAAVGAGVALNLPLDRIRSGIEGHPQVPGRLERVENGRGITILVDYAHTGDALENVLKTLKELEPPRIITLFGCGGDRDRGKRPVMGGVAALYSDLAILTSDNPRSEPPRSIIEEVMTGITPLGLRAYTPEDVADGFTEKGYVAMESRRDAIRLAVKVARPGDVVLLAGKGHEDYQIIGATKHHFDDREEAAAACREL